MAKKPAKLLRKQAPMRKMLIALLPPVLGAIYFFGWRSLAVVLVACLVGFLAELFFCRRRGDPVSEAVFVSAVIFGVIMPPFVPWHVVVIGMLVAIVITKELFGGFGRNIFNPAMAGRAFVYICLPIALTASQAWIPPAQGPWGALGKWTTAPPEVDAITTPSPMTVLKMSEEEIQKLPEPEKAKEPTLRQLFFGRISGTMGVTSAMLLLIGGTYLFVTKTANRTIILTLIITYAALNQILHVVGVFEFHALTAVMGGGFLFGAFYMATDPVSAAKTPKGRVIYSMIIAICTVIIRNWSIFNGGLMFSIILANTFVSIIDYAVKEHDKKKRERAKQQKEGKEGSS